MEPISHNRRLSRTNRSNTRTCHHCATSFWRENSALDLFLLQHSQSLVYDSLRFASSLSVAKLKARSEASRQKSKSEKYSSYFLVDRQQQKAQCVPCRMHAHHEFCSSSWTKWLRQEVHSRRWCLPYCCLYQGKYSNAFCSESIISKVLSNPTPQTTQIFAVESRNSLSTLLASKAQFQKHNVKKEKKITKIDQPDEPISFAQLMVRDGSDALEDELQSSLMTAVSGGQSNQEKQNPLSSRLNKVQKEF